MRKTHLHLSASEFKEKFSTYLQHSKKIRALETFTFTRRFAHSSFLKIIKECISTDFLEQKEEEFLNYMLDKYEVDYLTWCHKTKWVKKEILRNIQTQPASKWMEKQIEFNFAKNLQRKASEVPLEALMTQNLKSQPRSRL